MSSYAPYSIMMDKWDQGVGYNHGVADSLPLSNSNRTKKISRRVQCTGTGFKRVEETITRKGTRPLNKANSYTASDGTIVYPRNGYYYARKPDGSLIKGQGTFDEGLPCETCLKITPVDGLGIELDRDFTFEFEPMEEIDLEVEVEVVPQPEEFAPFPDTDMSWMDQGSDGCLDYLPVYTDQDVAFRNAEFLRFWFAAGLGGTPNDIIMPELTDEEFADVTRLGENNGSRIAHIVIDRALPSGVRFVKASEVESRECFTPLTPGPRSYIFCIPTNDNDITGGFGGAVHRGSLIVEIRYHIPNPYGAQDGSAWLPNQKFFYNENEDVVEPCDYWTMVEDDAPPANNEIVNSNASGGVITTEGSGVLPSTNEEPVRPAPQLPECIRQTPTGFIYCPPTTCKLPENASGAVVTPETMPEESYVYRSDDAGFLHQLTHEDANRIGTTHVWVPSPNIERQPMISAIDQWQTVPASDYGEVPRSIVERTLSQFPEITTDSSINQLRSYWQTLLQNAPLGDDILSYPLSNPLDIGIGPLGAVTESNTDSSPTNAAPQVCYEARFSLDPYPRWFANINNTWHEIAACCPQIDEECCDATRKDIAELKNSVLSLTELVMRNQAREATPVVDLSNLEAQLNEIRTRLDAQAPVTVYDDRQLLERIDSLENVVRAMQPGPQLTQYDDTLLRSQVQELKNLILARCQQAQPHVNYDTRFDQLVAMIAQLINRPVSTSTGEVQIVDNTAELNAILSAINSLRFATGREYDDRLAELKRIVEQIELTVPEAPDYTARFDEIQTLLQDVKSNSTRNYDSQFATLISLIAQLRSQPVQDYTARFDELRTLVSNIRSVSERDYSDRFNRLEALIASLDRSYPDYSPQINEIRTLVEQLRTTPQEPTGSSGNDSEGTKTSPCGATTINCGGNNDVRLDFILDELNRLRNSNATTTTTPTTSQYDVRLAIESIASRIDSMQQSVGVNTDRRFDEINSRLAQLSTLVSQSQSQTQSQNQNQNQSTTITNTWPAGGYSSGSPSDARIEAIARELATLQATTATMSSTLIALAKDAATTRSNYEQVQQVYQEYIAELQERIRSQGADRSTYTELDNAIAEFNRQQQTYERIIASQEQQLRSYAQLVDQQSHAPHAPSAPPPQVVYMMPMDTNGNYEGHHDEYYCEEEC